MLQVTAGDNVTLEVFARYTTSTSGNNTIINNLVTAVAGAFGIVNAGETQTAYQALNNNLPGTSALIPTVTNVPKAYLYYIIFNNSYVYQQFGYFSVPLEAALGHVPLKLEVNVPVNGFLYTYVANESNVSAATSVFFDDFTIIHEKNTYSLRVVESIDYDPFGVVLEGTHYVDISRPLNSYLYQGEFAEFEKLTGWSRFIGRGNYDAIIGRWSSTDPQSQFASPYLAMGNNPVIMIDPDGEWAFLATVAGKVFTKKAIAIGLKTGAINVISNYDTKEGIGWHTLGDFAAGFVGGALGVGFQSKLLGMAVGGFGTWAVNGASFDYGGLQEFVGGALSTYVGMGKQVKGKHTLFKEAKEGQETLVKFKKKNVLTNALMKHGDNFINYGLQNTAFDFAYSKEKDFRSRGWRHVDLFVWGGVSGAYQQIAFDRLDLFGASLLYQVIDWGINGAIKKGYNGIKINGSQANKLALNYYKWILQLSQL